MDQLKLFADLMQHRASREVNLEMENDNHREVWAPFDLPYAVFKREILAAEDNGMINNSFRLP